MEKYAARSVKQQIDRILWEVWDPPTVMKGDFRVALATLILLLPFSAGVGKEQSIVASGGSGTIVFTLAEWDCPSGRMLRPCVIRSNIWQINADGSGAQPLTRIKSFYCGSSEPVWSPDGTRIAFTSTCADQDSTAGSASGSNIWLMNTDGSGARPLTRFTQPVGAGGGVWSPSGRKLAFMSNALLDGGQARLKGNGSNVWVMNADGSGALPLTHITADDIGAGAVRTGGVCWSPNGQKLAFMSDRALDGSNSPNVNDVTNIWVMNADGSGSMPLTKLTAAYTYVSQPVWSPDSHSLAFSWHRALDNTDAVEPVSPSNIWVVNADGSKAKPLTRFTDKLTWGVSDPDWSPSGSELTFVANGNIWLVKPDGSGLKALTNFSWELRRAASNPIWSSDGTKIAFEYRHNSESRIAGQPTTLDIWVMNADGTESRPVTSSGGISGHLRWRPQQ